MQVATKEMSHDLRVEKVVKHWQNYCLDNLKEKPATYQP